MERTFVTLWYTYLEPIISNIFKAITNVITFIYVIERGKNNDPNLHCVKLSTNI